MTSGVASAIRPGLRDNRQISGSPHTPNRFISSNYSSPGSSFRQEEDAVIIELDSRGLKAGFEGESGPQCEIRFCQDNSRRVGDFRTWLPSHQRKEQPIEAWSKDYELWRTDLKDVDLGLLEDRLERAVREVYNKHLLTDAGNARLVLVLPSLVPHPVLSSMLKTLFDRWKFNTITLLPIPTMATVAAGLRSALVIDIGWEETAITPIYEYRELPSLRTVRALRTLNLNMLELLKDIKIGLPKSDQQQFLLDFDVVEEITNRVLSCRGGIDNVNGLLSKTADMSLAGTRNDQSMASSTSHVTIDWPTNGSSQAVLLPSSKIAKIVLESLIHNNADEHLDDHEQGVPSLAYKTLLNLPPDVRSSCISRIIFIGEGSRIPQIRQTVMQDLEHLIERHGWSAIRGKHAETIQSNDATAIPVQRSPIDARYDVPLPFGKDYVEERLQKQRTKEAQPNVHGSLREIETLGPWAGASLLASLKVRGFVEIERERFLSHGLTGANRETEMAVASQRVSSFGVASTKINDKPAWTLAGWA